MGVSLKKEKVKVKSVENQRIIHHGAVIEKIPGENCRCGHVICPEKLTEIYCGICHILLYNNRFESQKNFVIFSEKNHTRRSVSYKILPT